MTPENQETCRDAEFRVDLLAENEDAWKIFSIIRYQLIVSAGGAVDISHEAIHRAMELYGIENRRECFEKVTQILAPWWIGKMNDKGDGG